MGCRALLGNDVGRLLIPGRRVPQQGRVGGGLGRDPGPRGPEARSGNHGREGSGGTRCGANPRGAPSGGGDREIKNVGATVAMSYEITFA